MVSTSQFDSYEEFEFNLWIQEAKEHGLITNPVYQPASFILSGGVKVSFEKKLKTKTKIIEKTLLQPHIYTADWSFDLCIQFPPSIFWPVTGKVWIDIKGDWQNRGAKQEFSINRKWVFEKYGIYINKIVPKTFFQKTWCPELLRITPKTKKPVKHYSNAPTLQSQLLKYGIVEVTAENS